MYMDKIFKDFYLFIYLFIFSFFDACTGGTLLLYFTLLITNGSLFHGNFLSKRIDSIYLYR